MTIASDVTSWGASATRASVSTDKAIGGTTGHIGAAIPEPISHIAVIPEDSGVRFNIGGAATSSSPLVPLGGIIFNGSKGSFDQIHLYAASAVNVGFFLGGSNLRTLLGANLALGDISIGNVGLLNIAEAEIDPSEAQAANTAYAAADKLTPLGGVKSATRHTAAELETFADDDYVPVGVTAVHELRVRDDDANTDLDTIAAAKGILNTLTEKTPVKVSQFVSTASTAEALVGTETFATALYLQAKKAAADNVGNVFVGLSTLDSGTDEMFELTPGADFELKMPSFTKVDLNDVFIDSINNDDGVTGWYIPT